MESVHITLPDEVARSLAKQAADAGMSSQDYIVELVTQSVCPQVYDDLAVLLQSRADESKDVKDSPDFWKDIEDRVEARRKSRS